MRRVRGRRRADILPGGRCEFVHAMRSNGARRRDDDATTRPRDGAGARRRAPEGTFERRARDVPEDGRASFEAVNRARIIFIARSSRSWGRGDANARGRGR